MLADALDHAIDAYQDRIYEAKQAFKETFDPPQPAEHVFLCKECHVGMGNTHVRCAVGAVENTLLQIRSLHD